jgi:uncharacterized protein (TIGR01777 family)
MAKVLITGASGLIGSRLQQMLLGNGYDINTLGRNPKPAANPRINSFQWNLEDQTMDTASLAGVTTIIHLAGAGVADKRWTEDRKKEIVSSRTDSTKLLYKTLKSIPNLVKTIVSASAVGYYGDCGDEVVTEEHPAAENFLAEVTRQWEKEVRHFEEINIRHVCCRIGIVLAKNGGALPELVKTLPIGVAGYFAKSPLYYPWVHIDDVCGIMIHAAEDQQLRGSYNTTAPDPVSIRELMAAIIAVKKSKAVLVPVPVFALKIALGEMADMLLSSQKCSDQKILQTGYKFYFPDLKKALKNIYPLS